MISSVNEMMQKKALPVEFNSFEKHISDAIIVNRTRLPLYSKLTDGASKKVSRTFIFNQHVTLPVTWYVDALAKKFQKKDIPVVSIDMVSMELTPAFVAKAEQAPMPFADYKSINQSKISANIRKAFKNGGFFSASETIENELKKIENIPTYHNMTRHMLESMLRMSNLAPIYVELSKMKEMPSTHSLSKLLFKLHLIALIGCALLDKLAAPIQAKGIPIIQNDVPPIEAKPESINLWMKDAWEFYDSVKK